MPKTPWLAALLLATTGATGAIAAAPPLHAPLLDTSAVRWHDETTPRKWFIRLETPSVGEVRAARLAQRAPLPDANTQRRHSALISREQDRVSALLRPLVSRETGRLRIAVNGIKVIAPASALAAIRSLDGVRSVAPIAHHDFDNSASVGWVEAPQVWKSDGDGDDLTIAVIDTGIDYLHANFGGAGDPQEYANNDKNRVEPGSFPTVKVIGGWDFAGPTYNSREDDIPQPDADPLDGNGHGSHVAGTAAGIGVERRIGPGVAAGASLLALKVFSDESGSTDLTSDAIERALDPNQDGAMDDHVDVINMSLGSRFGDPSDPSALASSVAAQNGIVVVASAGNNGDKPYVTGSPAVSPDALSVAATIAGGRRPIALRVLAADSELDGLYIAAEGLGSVRIVDSPLRTDLVSAVSALLDEDGNVVPKQFTDQACATLVNGDAVAGKVALVARGGCSFETKYARVQMAGAAGILVYNIGITPDDPVPMGGVGVSGKVFTIPGLMISGTHGQRLKKALADAPLVVEFDTANTVAPLPQFADRLTSFTSRGPAHGGAAFKPEIAAPGRFTVSTAAGTGFRSRQLRGTSMAAPHVAGAAALLRQRHRDLPVAAIKALLQNATVDSQFDGPGSDTVVPLSRQGVGVLRIDAANRLGSYASPAGLSFGYLNPLGDAQRRVTGRVHDLRGEERLFEVNQRTRADTPGFTISCPSQVLVPANGNAHFAIDLAIDAQQLDADVGGLSHNEADGWCEFRDAHDTLRVGYLAAADPAAALTPSVSGERIQISNTGNAAGNAYGFRLAGNRGDRGEHASRPIVASGYRLGNTYGIDVFEFAVVLGESFESPAHITMHMQIDVEGDGRYDRVLFAGDWSTLGFDPGVFVSGVFDLDDDGQPLFDSGYLDWPVDQIDFNDRVFFATFTLSPQFGLSFLKPDQRSFDYRLVVSSRDGSYDVQTGHIDLTDDPLRDNAAYRVGPGQTVDVDTAAGQPDLWLLPQNQLAVQHATSAKARPGRSRPLQ